MVFAVDDLLIASIAATIAASAAAGAGAGLFAKGGSKLPLQTATDSTGAVKQFRFDGSIEGVDPVGTVGHTTDGYPVNSKGERLVDDGSAMTRAGMSSYDMVGMAQAISGATDVLIGTTGSNSLFGIKYPTGSGARRVPTIRNNLKNDPVWIETIAKAVLEDPGFNGWDMGNLKKTFAWHPEEFVDFINTVPAAQKAIYEQLKQKKVEWNIPMVVPNPIINRMPPDTTPPDTTTPTTAKPESGPSGDFTGGGGGIIPKIPIEGPSGDFTGGGGGVNIPINTITGGGTYSGGGGKVATDPDINPIPTGTTGTDSIPEVKGKNKEDDDTKKDKKGPKGGPRLPFYDDPEKTDSNIVEKTLTKPAIAKKPVQWYPTYKMGGQDILRLTDTEKLEEIRNWSLFDMVSTAIQQDPDNLLAIQNAISQNARFTNTYRSPNPPPVLPPPPDTQSWSRPMISSYPTPYPMRLDTAHSNKLYYDNWADPVDLHLNQKINMLSGATEPDLAQIANSNAKGWTAIDKQIARGNAKFSLCEDVDTSSIQFEDLQLFRR